jgi:hypothetical protein
MAEFERVKKTDDEIIDRLIEDTREEKLKWFASTDDLIYAKHRKIYGNTVVDVIFKLFDQFEEQYSEFAYYDFHDGFDTILVLDIYFSKNNKKEIFCKRISAYQLKLSNLVAIAKPIIEKKDK